MQHEAIEWWIVCWVGRKSGIDFGDEMTRLTLPTVAGQSALIPK